VPCVFLWSIRCFRKRRLSAVLRAVYPFSHLGTDVAPAGSDHGCVTDIRRSALQVRNRRGRHGRQTSIVLGLVRSLPWLPGWPPCLMVVLFVSPGRFFNKAVVSSRVASSLLRLVQTTCGFLHNITKVVVVAIGISSVASVTASCTRREEE
jgi:hypothetical protein